MPEALGVLDEGGDDGAFADHDVAVLSTGNENGRNQKVANNTNLLRLLELVSSSATEGLRLRNCVWTRSHVRQAQSAILAAKGKRIRNKAKAKDAAGIVHQQNRLLRLDEASKSAQL